MGDYKQFNPARVPDEDEGDIGSSQWDGATREIGDREYGKPRPAPPLTTDDSAKFGSAAPVDKF